MNGQQELSLTTVINSIDDCTKN
ncbi:hypothetical protein AVEN_147858-1, partial [Araneus ventricosus]